MTEEGYNGWKNYPTWCVNLWLLNDEAMYLNTSESVRFALKLAEGENQRVAVADGIKVFVGELVPDLGASFAADLLGYALDCVDWFELADAWIESVSEE